MSRLIDADELEYEREDGILTIDIKNAPTVDAVPVVRCGECIYRDTEMMYCGMVDLIRKNDDWYCADGERRDDE